MHKFFWLLLLPFALFAQDEPVTEHKTPEEIQQELNADEARFERAKKMFNPWYTGPLITPSASMMPVGTANIQPYLFVTDNYASFNGDRKSVSLASDLVVLKGTVLIQTGITNNLDVIASFTGLGNWQFHHHAGGFGDLTATAGFLIYKQSLYIPGIKFTIQETFPTGKYKHLNTNGLLLDDTGGGVYATQFGLAFSKLLAWTTQHPMNLRLFFGYQIATPAHVLGFNTYGGGFGTNGHVHVGNSLSVDFGYELSLSQRWVAALDIVYAANNANHFDGTLGTLANGSPAVIAGTTFSDNLSLAPAIEYNWNENMGLIAGAWFSVYGRNSLNFASAVISVTITFP